MSPTRAAGLPPISTVGQPGGMIGVGGCTAGGGNEHACMFPTVAAGSPPMSTVGTPGGMRTPGCPVMSPTLAAGGMVRSSVDLDDGTLDGEDTAGGHLGLGLAGDLDLGAFRLQFGLRRHGHLLALELQRPGAGVDRDAVLRLDVDGLAAGDLDVLRLLVEL